MLAERLFQGKKLSVYDIGEVGTDDLVRLACEQVITYCGISIAMFQAQQGSKIVRPTLVS